MSVLENLLFLSLRVAVRGTLNASLESKKCQTDLKASKKSSVK